tara:strand:+ start:1903 stop:2574 length:672 start_codon:yes stop_codon:yes gene_type:complete
MYFSLIPDIEYDSKPISYPFSESDFIIAKNFFRRYKIDDDVFGYATFYNKYAVGDGERIENIADAYYGSPFYDWVIILTNNFINPQFAFPVNSETVRKIAEEKYGEVDAYSGIHHYETIEKKSGETVDNLDILALEGGLTVDKKFYDSPFKYWNGSSTVTVNGNTVSKSITNYEHEVAINEKKREIYILRRTYFRRFINDFKKKNLYTESSDFITKRLKKTGI